MLDFDSMLFQVGEFGLYQKLLFLIQAPFCILFAFVAFSQLFMQNYPPVFWCQQGDNIEVFKCSTLSPAQKQNLSYPFVNGAIDACNRLVIDQLFIRKLSNEEKVHLRNGTCAENTDPCQYNGSIWYSNSRRRDSIFLEPSTKRNNGAKPRNNNPDVAGSNPISTITSTTERTRYWRNDPSRQGYGSNYYGQGNIFPKDQRGYGQSGSTRTVGQSQSSIECGIKNSLNPSTRLEFENVTNSNNPIIRTISGACSNVRWESPPGRYAIYYPTVVSEGNWFCNANIYVTISQSFYFAGAIVGSFLIGWVADTFGRLPAFVLANVVGSIGGLLSTTTSNFYLFTFFRFITGMAFDNCYMMLYILVLEFCGPSYRTVVANLSIGIFYTFGTVILPWIAVWCGDWRLFGRVTALPMLLALTVPFIVPESSRWLLSKGKAKQATDILRRFANVNRRKVDESVFIEFQEGAQKMYDEVIKNEVEPSVVEAFKTPRLRTTFLVLVIMWSCTSLVYDGHNRNILNLANAEWNLYWLFTFASLTEFPADILLILTLDRFGRRWLAFTSLCLSGLCSVVAAAVPRDLWTATLVMALISRFWINISVKIGLQYANELLPTVIRAQGVNIIHIIGYVATIFSPVIALVGRTQPALSLIFLGALAVTGGILSLYLPETLGEYLPNTLEEAEAFGKNQSFWNCPICAKREFIDEVDDGEPSAEVAKLRDSFRAAPRGSISSSIINNPNKQKSFEIDSVPNESTRLRRVQTN